MSGLCLTQLGIISLSQKVDLHSKIFRSIFIYSIVHVGWLAYRLWSLKKYSFWSSCMEYTTNKVWTATKLKDTVIRISYLKYFKLSLQISNFRRILTQAEFQCVHVQNNILMKEWNNLSLPWTPQGEKASGNHQIILPRENATCTSLIFPIC